MSFLMTSGLYTPKVKHLSYCRWREAPLSFNCYKGTIPDNAVAKKMIGHLLPAHDSWIFPTGSLCHGIHPSTVPHCGRRYQPQPHASTGLEHTAPSTTASELLGSQWWDQILHAPNGNCCSCWDCHPIACFSCGIILPNHSRNCMVGGLTNSATSKCFLIHLLHPLCWLEDMGFLS